MKIWIRSAVICGLMLTLFGCATSSQQYETRLQPSEGFNPIFLKYKELPGEKVIVVAVDPSGNWAFGYDHGKTSLSEAAEVAATRCDKARENFKVFSKAKIFAINNQVVYYDKQFQ